MIRRVRRYTTMSGEYVALRKLQAPVSGAGELYDWGTLLERVALSWSALHDVRKFGTTRYSYLAVALFVLPSFEGLFNCHWFCGKDCLAGHRSTGSIL